MSTITAQPTTTRPTVATKSAAASRTGLVMTALVTLFLGFDSVSHLLNVEAVQKANAELGSPAGFVGVCGVVLALCLVTYLVPRTALLGAVLLTGYLGGACAVNLFTEQPLFNTFFAVLTGVFVWGGLWFRDDRVKALYTR